MHRRGIKAIPEGDSKWYQKNLSDKMVAPKPESDGDEGFEY